MFSSLAVIFACFNLLVLSTSIKTEDEGCSIKLNGDLPDRKQPLYLKKSGSFYELVTPTIKNKEGVIELKKNEQLTLACPGRNNYLVLNKKTTTESECVKSTTLTIDNSKTFSTKDGYCANQVQAEIKATVTRCSQIGKVYEIGFQIQGWHLMISACHDTSASNTLYTKHRLKGTAIGGAERESARPKFEDGNLGELYTGFNPDDFYKKKNQGTLFQTVCGKTQAKKYFTNDSDLFLSRGHMAPDGDFIFGSEQFSTYFYINVAPQWQSINSGNWLSVEKMIRKYATKTKKELTIITGTYGILELEDDKGKLQKMYLNNEKKKIPIPSYYWKVMYDPSTASGIAIVTSNNPFGKKETKISFCQKACEDYSWTFTNSKTEFANVTRGLTSCCSVGDLRKEISHVPFLDVQSVLRGNS